MGKPDQESAAAEEARRATGRRRRARPWGTVVSPAQARDGAAVYCAERISSPCRGSWGSRRRGPRSGGISFWPRARPA